MDEWINDGEWYCTNCDINFKVYVKEDVQSIGFCPICANRDLEAVEDEL